ncbi:hypothetical protein DPMN_192476 [Dreissena polymorpha]|uniref:Uncharacterized protein n=1 Tax=Dreissena polymorpha TaxID=45954 RepID=A0A9D3Y4W5_DREPO|nr:hypothetical protein DPMN_192476 [Dreissena polymorpha]
MKTAKFDRVLHAARASYKRTYTVVEIDCIVIREVQYQLEVNRCRNEEIIPMWARRSRVGNGAIHRSESYRNEEINFQGSTVLIDGQTDGKTGGGDNHNIHTLLKKLGDNNNVN